jgi:Tol biopolymer transport system component
MAVARQLTEDRGDYDQPGRPTPDRLHLRSQQLPVFYTIDPEQGGEPTALTQNSYNYQPDWSPDGASIALSRRIMGPPKVFTMPALGRSPRECRPRVFAETSLLLQSKVFSRR